MQYLVNLSVYLSHLSMYLNMWLSSVFLLVCGKTIGNNSEESKESEWSVIWTNRLG